MKITKKLSIFLGGLSLAAVVAGSAYAGSPFGTWERPSTGGQIEVYECKGGLGMKVLKSPKADSVGKVMMCGAKADGTNKWKGDLQSPEDGNTYSGHVTLINDKTLKLDGCAGKVCKGDEWKKIK